MIEQNRKQSQGKQSITRHPLFPVIVALWFGALFGLGGLAVRPSLLESMVLALHLDAIVPALAPPLGLTFRILMGLTLAGIGGALGAAIGRRVAGGKPVVHERKRGAVSGARDDEPLSPAVFESADDAEELPAPAPGIGRRRPLAISDSQDIYGYSERAPLPGGAPQILNVADFGIDAIEEEEALRQAAANAGGGADAHGEDPLDLTGFAPGDEGFDPAQDDAAPAISPLAFGRNVERQPVEGLPEPEPLANGDIAEFDLADFDVAAELSVDHAAPDPVACEPAAERHEPFEAQPALASFAAPQIAEDAAEPHRAGDDAPETAEAELAELSHEQLVDRLSQSLRRRRERKLAARQAAAARAAAEAEAAAAAAAARSLPAVLAMQDADAVEEAADIPEVAAVAEAPAAHADLHEVAEMPAAEADEADDDAQAQPAGPPFALPAALRSVSLPELDEEEDDDWLPGFLPPRQIAVPAARAPLETAAASEEDAEADGCAPTVRRFDLAASAEEDATDAGESEDDSATLEAGYSSLLDFSRPTPPREGFIRIEEPEAETEADEEAEPVVDFPAHEAQADAAAASRRFDAPAMGAAVTAQAGQANEAHAAPETEAPAAPVRADAAPRPFDAPPERFAPVQAPAPLLVNVHDAEETERALRAALSTLQRMSGAA